ncbi:PKD-like family lipoprotein [Sphingobacterium bovistauri]|uniref:PKD-like family protein n=1 Tax=Sphingobacterium bovistauri TaxID=2781959 RepID=A0ABS7Z985_9SPHI|nr:PKD-like family lipoprotein [Sphingobacterium bovistauri]MCA5006757.1 hypothetical protein [Sphingobacterium bovistauri]
MKKLYILIYSCLTLFVLYSCTKDSGNYTYTDINTVSINTSDSVFTIQQLERLTINPDLAESIPDDKNSYSYEWLMFPTQTSNTFVQIENEEAVLLSREKNLDQIITLPPKLYFIQYTVKNEITGIKSIKRFTVNITAAFHEGWLLMTNVDNKAKLSFIRRDGNVYLDPLKDYNNITLKGKGLASFTAVTGQIKDIYVFTNEEISRLTANDFLVSANQNNLFNLFTIPANIESPFFAISASSSEQYIIANGKVHATTNPIFGVSKYSIPFSGQSGKLFPFIFYGETTYISFYDNENKRFLQSSFFGRALQTFSNNINNKYDLNNVGKTMVAADLGAQREFYTIMKDNSNQYYFYAYNPFTTNQATSFQKIQNSPEIDKAISFASSSSIPHIYYATDNKIYLYDIQSNSSRGPLYEFPSGTKVKMISMYKHKGWGSTAITDPDFNKILVVAANTATEGSVYYFRLDPTGNFENQKFEKVYNGFGQIEHINYRNRNEQ